MGTPGRIKDLVERECLDLSQLSHVVLDEVDRMLDMGFADDVESILTYRYSGNYFVPFCMFEHGDLVKHNSVRVTWVPEQSSWSVGHP